MTSSYNSHLLCCLCVTVIHCMCCVLWSDLAQLQTMVHCCNMVVRPGPVLLAQPGSCTVHYKNDIHRMNTEWRPAVVLRMKCTGFSSGAAATFMDNGHLVEVWEVDFLMWYATNLLYLIRKDTINLVFLVSIATQISTSSILQSLSMVPSQI